MFSDFYFFKPRAVRKSNIDDAEATWSQVVEKAVDEDYKANYKKYARGEYEEKDPKSRKTKKFSAITKLILQTGDADDAELQVNVILPYLDIVMIIFSLANPLYDLLNFIDLYLVYGAAYCLILNFVLNFLFAAPMFLVFFFLGNYSKQKYIKFWTCVPMLKGVSIVVCIVNYYYAILNVTLSGLALDLAVSYVWDHDVGCSLSDEACPNFNATTSFMQTEKSNPFIELLMIITNKEGPLSPNWHWNLMTFVQWSLILICIMFNRTMIHIVCKAILVLWVLIVVISLVLSGFVQSYRQLDLWHGNASHLSDMKFWIRSTLLILRRMEPGDLISYGAMGHPGMDPTNEALINIGVRFLITVMVSNWVSMGLIFFVDYSDITDTSSMSLDGLVVIFAIIPSIFSKTSLVLVILYYILIATWGFSCAYYSFNAFTEAIFNNAPKFRTYAKSIIAIVLGVGVVISLFFVSNRFYAIYQMERENTVGPLVVAVCTAMFFVFYSPMRIMNDFHFSFGYRLGSGWRICLKFYVVYILSLTVGFVLHIVKKRDFVINNLLFNILFGLVCLMPAVLVAVTNYINFKHQKQLYLLKPDSKWGPSNKMTRDARRRFNPKCESKYQGTGKCKHDCLRQSELALGVVEKWNARRSYFFCKYRVGSFVNNPKSVGLHLE